MDDDNGLLTQFNCLSGSYICTATELKEDPVLGLRLLLYETGSSSSGKRIATVL
jgi:hypothetical protein